MHDNEIVRQIELRVADPKKRIDMLYEERVAIFPPVLSSMLCVAEEQLSLSLPQLLRQLYLKIGNGGFGPGYGLLGFVGGHLNVEGMSIVDVYFDHLSQIENWPKSILPICEWGESIWTCLDCNTNAGDIITMTEDGLFRTQHNLGSWVGSWAKGVDLWKQMFNFEEVKIKNPFTGAEVSHLSPGAAKGNLVMLF